MVPGIPGGWVRKEFYRRLRRWLLAGLAIGAGGAIASGLWWVLPLALVVPVADRKLRDAVLGDTLPWLKGARGEEAVARYLDTLEPHGYRILHDVPTDRGNVDHAVVGPTGAFAVETKAWAGRLYVKGGRLMRGGGNAMEAVRQATAEAMEVRRRLHLAGLDVWVDAVIAVTGGKLSRGPMRVKDVAILAAEDVRSYILGAKTVLSPSEVARAVAAILRGDAPVSVRSISYEDVPADGSPDPARDRGAPE